MEGTCFRKTIDEIFLERKKKWIKTYQTDDTSRYWIHRDIGGMGYTD